MGLNLLKEQLSDTWTDSRLENPTWYGQQYHTKNDILLMCGTQVLLLYIK